MRAALETLRLSVHQQRPIIAGYLNDILTLADQTCTDLSEPVIEPIIEPVGKLVSKPNTEEDIAMLIWGRLHAEVEGRDLVPWLISQLLATSPDLPGLRNSVLYFLRVSAE
jgi:hypothetical protein